jgi:hypothetical protein
LENIRDYVIARLRAEGALAMDAHTDGVHVLVAVPDDEHGGLLLALSV